MTTQPTLYIGTSNTGKVVEFVPLIAPLGLSVQVVTSEEEIIEPSGDQNDGFLENATVKARAYAEISGGITLSEDSGLSVAALGGLPGIWSARFCDLDVTSKQLRSSNRPREEIDPLNNARVLELLHGVEQPRRAAMFKIALVIACKGEVLFSATAQRHGWIAEAARGTRGFGYDPIFIGQDTYGKTYAEIDPVRKNLKSHRKEVMDHLFFWLSKNMEIFSP